MLCIDCGNTRLKWACHDGAAWQAEGVLAYDSLAAQAPQLVAWQAASKVVVSNVAGAAAADRLRAVLPRDAALSFLASSDRACGVHNDYLRPEALGVDRWCALVGAWGLRPVASLVISAGTATTIDTLDERGHFLGGFILPGVDMMRTALARNTAQLPLAAGRHQHYPRCTDDAISSGVIEATVGAIERAHARLGKGAPCILTGGAASLLLPQLAIPCEMNEKLVLEGVWRLGQTAL